MEYGLFEKESHFHEDLSKIPESIHFMDRMTAWGLVRDSISLRICSWNPFGLASFDCSVAKSEEDVERIKERRKGGTGGTRLS